MSPSLFTVHHDFYGLCTLLDSDHLLSREWWWWGLEVWVTVVMFSLTGKVKNTHLYTYSYVCTYKPRLPISVVPVGVLSRVVVETQVEGEPNRLSSSVLFFDP